MWAEQNWNNNKIEWNVKIRENLNESRFREQGSVDQPGTKKKPSESVFDCTVLKHCAALLQIGDLKTQLESCHQQLHDSNKHKQELEFQLRTALEREQDIRTGYISPVSHQLLLFSVQLHCLFYLDGKPCCRFHEACSLFGKTLSSIW